MKNFLFWVPAGVYAILISSLSHLSHPPGGDSAPYYLLHFIEYGLFAVTVLIGITRMFKAELGLKQMVITLLIVVIYAAIDEYHQTFIPRRDGSLRDWISDAVGAFVFVSVIWFLQKQIKGLLRH